jgi:hypothetical protein
MNETINAALNATQNETLRNATNQAGSFALDKVLNSNWGEGLATTLNALLNTTFFNGSLVSALVPCITLVLLWWKWGAICNAVQTFGSTIIIILILYVGAKALGVL